MYKLLESEKYYSCICRGLFAFIFFLPFFQSCKREGNLQNHERQHVSYEKTFPCNKLVNLEGEQLFTDTVIFRVFEPELLIKDSILVIKTHREPIMLFQLPEIRFLGYRGGVGNGPKEFLNARLIPSTDEDLICYVYDEMKCSLFKLYKNKKFFSTYSPLKMEMGSRSIGDISQNKILYANMSNMSITITEKVISDKKVETHDLIQLALPSGPEKWYCYIGNLSVNRDKDRMVFAYKYYKKIIFMKLNGEVIRVIDFPNTPGYDEKTIGMHDGLDMNVSHYIEISTGNNYVYLSYSGRKPEDVKKEWENGIYNQYLEQYDWDGNPVQTYKLDKWGSTTVDEKNGHIYLLSSAFDEPLFRFKIKNE